MHAGSALHSHLSKAWKSRCLPLASDQQLWDSEPCLRHWNCCCPGQTLYPWHRNPALHPLRSLVLGLLHQRVLGLHHAQHLVDVGLQPGHDSRVLPQGVCPAHVQGCQLVQGGRLAMGDGCYSQHPPPPPPPAPQGVVRVQLCAGLWRRNMRGLAQAPAWILPSTFTRTSASIYF